MSEDNFQNVQNAADDIQGDSISPEGEEGSEKPSGNEKIQTPQKIQKKQHPKTSQKNKRLNCCKF